jgi:hypothetical protein
MKFIIKKWVNTNWETLKEAIAISLRDIAIEAEATDIIDRMSE